MRQMELTARIHLEDGGYWADVPGLPGCFASGHTLDERCSSRCRRASRCTSSRARSAGPLHLASATLTD